MKKINILLLLVLCIFFGNAQESGAWLVHMDEAKEQAKEKELPILISFSGSDWCGNCMRLSKDLFETEEFLNHASENLVLLNLDFPAKKANKLSEELSAQNEALAERYNKQGTFPLTILVDAQGEVLGKMKYPSPNVEAYLNNIESIVK